MVTPCVNTGGNTPSRPAQPVHRLQGIRFPGRDYRIPAFYMITMTVLDRKPLFATCEKGDRAERTGCWRVGHPIEAGRLRPLLQTAWSLLRPLCAGQAPDPLLPSSVTYSRNAHAYDVPGHESLVRGNSIASRPIASCWPLRKRTHEWVQDALYFRLLPPSSVRSTSCERHSCCVCACQSESGRRAFPIPCEYRCSARRTARRCAAAWG